MTEECCFSFYFSKAFSCLKSKFVLFVCSPWTLCTLLCFQCDRYHKLDVEACRVMINVPKNVKSFKRQQETKTRTSSRVKATERNRAMPKLCPDAALKGVMDPTKTVWWLYQSQVICSKHIDKRLHTQKQRI